MSFPRKTGLKQPLVYRPNPEIPISPARLASNILTYIGKAPKCHPRWRDVPQTASYIGKAPKIKSHWRDYPQAASPI